MQTNEQGGAEARYQAALNEGRFLIQRCNDCDKHVFYPRMRLPALRQRLARLGGAQGDRDRLFDHHRAAQAGSGRRL